MKFEYGPPPASGLTKLGVKEQTAAQLFRFVWVGLFNTAFGYGCYAFFLWIGLHYALAAAISTVLGVTFNFFSARGLVFRTKVQGRGLRFAASYALQYVLNIGILKALIEAGMNAYTGGLVLLLPSALVSFLLQKYWVFYHD